MHLTPVMFFFWEWSSTSCLPPHNLTRKPSSPVLRLALKASCYINGSSSQPSTCPCLWASVHRHPSTTFLITRIINPEVCGQTASGIMPIININQGQQQTPTNKKIDVHMSTPFTHNTGNTCVGWVVCQNIDARRTSVPSKLGHMPKHALKKNSGPPQIGIPSDKVRYE